MATRPCFSSASRKSRKPCLSPILLKPRGSKYPRGGIAPTCFDGSNGGGAGGLGFAGAGGGESCFFTLESVPAAACRLMRPLTAPAATSAAPASMKLVMPARADEVWAGATGDTCSPDV